MAQHPNLRQTRIHPGRGLGLLLSLPLFLGLAACGDRISDYPTLAPTDALLAPPPLPAHAADAARSPEKVAGDLRAEAQGLSARANRAPHANTGDLAERARALRIRAAALSKTDISGESAPACPPNTSGNPACDGQATDATTPPPSNP